MQLASSGDVRTSRGEVIAQTSRQFSERWSFVHAKTTPLVQAIATPESLSPTAVAARLPAGTLDTATLALALTRERTGRKAHDDELERLLEELDGILDEMHYDARKREAAVSALPLETASAHCAGGVLSSLTDKTMVATAPLRCYEAELALKREVAVRLLRRVKPTNAQVQALLVMWQSQPMLEPVEAMREGAEQQEDFERRLASDAT